MAKMDTIEWVLTFKVNNLIAISFWIFADSYD